MENTAGASGVDDSLYFNLGNGGYDAPYYDTTLNIDSDKNAINGIVAIRVKAT